MNRRPEKRLEADMRTPREKLYHLLYACQKADLAWVERKVRAMNKTATTPLIFSTKEGAA